MEMHTNDKLSAVILDDDEVFARLLKDKIEGMAEKFELNLAITVFSNPKELESCAPSYELLFLDIEFPEEDGIEWISRWRNTEKFKNIIYVSAHDEWVFRSFESEPVAFVRKTKLDADLYMALELYKKKISSPPIQVMIPEGKKYHFFEVNNILYLKGCRHYIDFVLSSGSIKVIRGKMDCMEKILKRHGFIRIQVSYLLNVKYIDVIDKKCVCMTNGEIFNISPKYQKDVLEQLKVFFRKCGQENV